MKASQVFKFIFYCLGSRKKGYHLLHGVSDLIFFPFCIFPGSYAWKMKAIINDIYSSKNVAGEQIDRQSFPFKLYFYQSSRHRELIIKSKHIWNNGNVTEVNLSKGFNLLVLVNGLLVVDCSKYDENRNYGHRQS